MSILVDPVAGYYYTSYIHNVCCTDVSGPQEERRWEIRESNKIERYVMKNKTSVIKLKIKETNIKILNRCSLIRKSKRRKKERKERKNYKRYQESLK